MTIRENLKKKKKMGGVLLLSTLAKWALGWRASHTYEHTKQLWQTLFKYTARNVSITK